MAPDIASDIFKCIFFIENCCILIKISLNVVRKDPSDNTSSLVQVMAWHRVGGKPLVITLTNNEPFYYRYVRLPASVCWSTHWGRYKIAAISQTTFWNAFS